jgi:predicted small lipoprotein YifL
LIDTGLNFPPDRSNPIQKLASMRIHHARLRKPNITMAWHSRRRPGATIRHLMARLMVACAATILVGCGQKGPLTLPQPQFPAPSSTPRETPPENSRGRPGQSPGVARP